MVCSNHMNIQDEVNQVVIHELIHAFDDCRAANLDWANCAHHACSEVCICNQPFSFPGLVSYSRGLHSFVSASYFHSGAFLTYIFGI